MSRFFFALAFLTRIPVPAGVHTRESNENGALGRAALHFPLIGFGIGLAFALGVEGLRLLMPTQLAIWIVLALEMIATGALHEIGLAHTAEAFGHARDRKGTLASFADRRIGVYGAVALLFYFALRVQLVEALVGTELFVALAMSAGFSRWMMLAHLMRLPPIEGRKSLAEGWSEGLDWSLFVLAGAPALACIAFLSVATPMLLLFGVLLLGGVHIAGLYCVDGRLRGSTGDVLGAVCCVTHLAALLTVVLARA